MKKIYLKRMTLNNFKGIKFLEIDFEETQTDILGNNGTGKTTIFDGFTWLLFGKDHTDSAKFEIKTLDENNNATPKLEHEIEAELIVDGESIIIRRNYKEKWVKQRGSSEAVLTGHTTSYFYNNVPLSSTEYSKKIDDIIDEKLFKLLTNPFNFNSLPWTSRRTILTSLANIVSDEELASEKQDFVELLQKLSGKSFDEYKREIAASKKRLKSELDEIPTRIDELHRSLPEKENWDDVKAKISLKNEEVDNVVTQIIDSSKVDEAQANKIKNKQQDVIAYEMQQSALKNEAVKLQSQTHREYDSNVNAHKQKIQANGFEVEKLEKDHEHLMFGKRSTEQLMSNLRKDFDELQGLELAYDESEFSCPTCKREFEPHKVVEMQTEMQSNFNTEKAEKLNAINVRGKELKNQLEVIDKNIASTNTKKEEAEKLAISLKEELDNFDKAPTLTVDEILNANEDYKQSQNNMVVAKNELEALRNEVVGKDEELLKSLNDKKLSLKGEINDLTKTYYKKEQLELGNNRIKKLEEKAKYFAQQLADVEKSEYLMEQFVSLKMNRIEESINGMFPTVQFKMFCTQLNGGVSECCDTLINGVPFDNANNAAKIQAGIEIINVLSHFHGKSAPIFVDNAESVVVLPFTESQLIRLIVSENHISLTVK